MPHTPPRGFPHGGDDRGIAARRIVEVRISNRIWQIDFLVKNEALSEELRARMLVWRHGGFSTHNEVRVAAGDTEGRTKLAGYMLRAPMSLQKITYDAATGTVIYRPKMHGRLKRNFQVMPGAEWLALLCKHIPDR